MFKLKNKFKTIYFSLIIYIGLLFLFNNHQVMAMQNNKNKQISKQEPTGEEVNDFVRLAKKQKEIIKKIKQKHPHLHNASVKEIEQWICSDINQKTESQLSNKKQKKINLDLNTIPKDN